VLAIVLQLLNLASVHTTSEPVAQRAASIVFAAYTSLSHQIPIATIFAAL